MKILDLPTTFFKLSDDFDGTLSDALFELAEYHKQKESEEDDKRETFSDKVPENFHEQPYNSVIRAFFWDEFHDIVQQGKRNLMWDPTILAYNEERK